MFTNAASVAPASRSDVNASSLCVDNSDTVVSTQPVADLLGVSPMTVVRLVDRAELTAQGGGVHRRITASELTHYHAASSARRSAALHGLAQEISQDTPPDEVIRTR